MIFKKIVTGLILTYSALIASTELKEGYYVDSITQDSIYVTPATESVSLDYNNGNSVNFSLSNNKYKTEKLSGEGSYSLIIKSDDSFQLIDDTGGNGIATFKLYATPGLFKKLLSVLVSSALIFSVIQAYLKVNKVWKRRKNVEVANSISIVAAMLGFAVGLPFLLNNIFITHDYFSAGKVVLGLSLAVIFTLIGTGYFVDSNRNVNFFVLLGRALNLEGKESGELISDMLRPKGANKIIEILMFLLIK